MGETFFSKREEISQCWFFCDRDGDEKEEGKRRKRKDQACNSRLQLLPRKRETSPSWIVIIYVANSSSPAFLSFSPLLP